jgi:hypothetical protein
VEGERVTKALLAIHVIVAIIAVGPMAVAASMFPAMARRSLDAARLLHRICRVYAYVGIAVPFFGLATAGALHVIGSPWLIASMILTALAAAVMGAVIVPRQKRALGLETVDRTLAMYTGLFNLLWVAVTVLMIVRPGSTTGV